MLVSSAAGGVFGLASKGLMAPQPLSGAGNYLGGKMRCSVMESISSAKPKPPLNWRRYRKTVIPPTKTAQMPSWFDFFAKLYPFRRRNPPAKLCLTPHWGTATHDVIFENICNNLSLKNYYLNYAYYKIHFKQFPFSYLMSLALFALYFPKIRALEKKGDIRALSVLGINIGYSINEEAICQSSNAEFKFDRDGYRLIRTAIFTLTRLYYCFNRKKIALVLGGDEVYILYSIAAQLAARHSVPCYFLKGDTDLRLWRFDCEKLTTSPFLMASLAQLDDFILKNSDASQIFVARRSLEERVRGDRKSLEYMPKASEQNHGVNLPDGCIWIYIHDFYDAPGLFGDNIFVNHVAWVRQTIQFCQEQCVPVAIKLHPNQRPLNCAIINSLRSEFVGDNIHWISDDFGPILLLTHRAKAVLTIYGTITVEATFAGVPVIAAGSTPFSNFDVAYQARNIAEYFSLIKKAVDGEGLAPKSKEVAVLAEAVFRSGSTDFGQVASDIPFDDVSAAIWQKVYGDEYPKYNYQRRDRFLRDPVLANFLANYLQHRNLAAELGLDKLMSARACSIR